MVLTPQVLGTLPQVAPGGAWPLVILLLALAWAGFLAAAALLVTTHFLFEPRTTNHEPRAPTWDARPWRATIVGVGAFVLALGAALLLSPAPPVLSTYTGLAHITSAYRIAGLEWNVPFPSDYPLAVPAFAAAFVRILGKSPESFSLANCVLSGLGAAGVALLAFRLFRSVLAASVAGSLYALLPLALLLAGGDGLTVGYAAVSAWAVLFALEVIQERTGSGDGRSGQGGAARRALRGLPFVGLVCALVLVCQTRLEALLFPALVLLLPFAACERDERLAGLKRVFLAVGLALAVLVPHLSVFWEEFVVGGRIGSELGFHFVGRFAGGSLAVCAGLLALGHLQKRRKLPAWAPAASAGALFAAFCGTAAFVFGAGFLDSSLACFDQWCTAGTFKTVPAWHFNPKVVPLGAALLFCLGLTGCKGFKEARIRAFLVLWFGAILAAASVKATGELPFEGARTQLPATVPFVLLCAAGAQHLASASRRSWIGAAAAAALLLPFLPQTVANIRTLDYDQQREFSFFRSCLTSRKQSKIENRKSKIADALYAPDDVVQVRLLGDVHLTPVDLFALYRTGYLLEAMGDGTPRLKVEQVSALLDGAQEASAAQNAWYMRNLSCYRTGDGSVTPSCRRAERELVLEPVCETVIPDAPYTSDFYEGTRIGRDVTVWLYRIMGRKEVF